MRDSVRAQGRVGVFPERVAGSLAYLTFIPAVIFLFLKPYSQNRFARFHSFQCVFFSASVIVAAIAVRVIGLVLFFLPVVGSLLMWLVAIVLIFAAGIVWLVLVIKALQGEAFELPVIGPYADRLAGAY